MVELDAKDDVVAAKDDAIAAKDDVIASKDDVIAVKDDVIAAMRGMRGLGPRDENDFNITASAQIAELFNQLTGIFFLVILLLASAGLLVGGVGVVGGVGGVWPRKRGRAVKRD